MNIIGIDFRKHSDVLVSDIYGSGGTEFVKTVNLIRPVNGNVTLTMDDIPETEARSFSKINVAICNINAKLDTVAEGATKTEKSDINGNIKINDVETNVYTNLWDTFQ